LTQFVQAAFALVAGEGAGRETPLVPGAASVARLDHPNINQGGPSPSSGKRIRSTGRAGEDIRDSRAIRLSSPEDRQRRRRLARPISAKTPARLPAATALIPIMKLRLAAAGASRRSRAIGDLRGIRAEGTGHRHRRHDDGARGQSPRTAPAAKVPDPRGNRPRHRRPAVRALGTIGGNAANGDPGNDMPAVMMALGASYQLTGKAGERRVAARDYYRGIYLTALNPGEILTAIRIPVPPAGHGYAYEKLKRKVGDFATCSRSRGRAHSFGRQGRELRHRPDQCRREGAHCRGGGADRHRIDARRGNVAKAVAAAEAITSPATDGHGPAGYRTKMAGVMVRRALARAMGRAA